MQKSTYEENGGGGGGGREYAQKCAFGGGGLGACSPIKALNFLPYEIAFGALSDSFVVLK